MLIFLEIWAYGENKRDIVSISHIPTRNTRKHTKTIISIRNLKYVLRVFIPLLDSLTFFSKEGLD